MRRLGVALAVALTGCSSTVTQQSSGSAGGTGGGSSSSGQSSATSSAQSSSSGMVNGACGGFYEYFCTPDYYCDYAPSCAVGDNVGVCKPRPTACDQDCAMVCGCDGKAYCSACVAHMAGVTITTSTTCLAETYSATPLFTNVERLALFKVDAQKRCVRIVLALEGAPTLGTMSLPPGWVIESAEVTNTASDCALQNGVLTKPSDLSAPAVDSSGMLVFPSGDKPPKDLTVHGALTFIPSGWVPASEALSADGLSISP